VLGVMIAEQPTSQPMAQPVVQVKEKIVRPLGQLKEKTDWRGILVPSGIILAIILAGTVTGYLLSSRKGSGPAVIGDGEKIVQTAKEVGMKDTEFFPDTTEGKIMVNDSEAITEGSHKLARPGGASQTAYLTSSVVDLNQFLGKCVQVWGETFAAQSAGWFMDVGRVKILDSCPEGL